LVSVCHYIIRKTGILKLILMITFHEEYFLICHTVALPLAIYEYRRSPVATAHHDILVELLRWLEHFNHGRIVVS
jgi:hypothetical protein